MEMCPSQRKCDGKISKPRVIRSLGVGMCGHIACAQILLSFAFQQNESLFNMAGGWICLKRDKCQLFGLFEFLF